MRWRISWLHPLPPRPSPSLEKIIERVIERVTREREKLPTGARATPRRQSSAATRSICAPANTRWPHRRDLHRHAQGRRCLPGDDEQFRHRHLAGSAIWRAADTSDFGNTALGKGIQEGKTNLLSTGWTRGHKPTLVSGGQVDRTSGEPKGAATAAPAKASSGGTVTAFSGSAARKLETVAAVSISTSEIVAFKRDYEERAVEQPEETAGETGTEPDVTALFSDKAAAEAAAAKSDAKKLEAERRIRSIAQGYTGNMCSECQNFTMVRNGTCEKCDTCGATSGCS